MLAAAMAVSIASAAAWGAEQRTPPPPAKGGRVKFSDTPAGPAVPDRGAIGPLIKRQVNTSIQPGSSLSGVAAPPFAPMAPAAPVAVPLDRGSDDAAAPWIIRSPDDFAITSESAERAFGVRPADRESPLEPSDRTGWEALMQAREGDQTEPGDERRSTAADPEDPSARPIFASPGAPTAGFDREPPTDWTGLGRTGSRALRNQGLVDSELDVGLSLQRNLTAEPRARSPFSRLLATDRPLTSIDRARDARNDQFRDMLGVAPEVSPLADPMGGRLDPINTQPDLTKRELNPVTAVNPAQSSGNLVAPFLSSTAPVGTGPRLSRSDFGWQPSLTTRPRTDSSAPLLAPAFDPRKQLMAPVRLDIPRRGNF